MIREVVDRLLKVYGVTNKSKYLGHENYRKLNAFLQETKTDNIYNRRLFAIKQVAKMLNVPTHFIIRILILEGVKEIWT